MVTKAARSLGQNIDIFVQCTIDCLDVVNRSALYKGKNAVNTGLQAGTDVAESHEKKLRNKEFP